MDMLNALAGLFVGILVGMTGVGGGSLMAPIMILFIGVAPITAVGTDLWFAAITKTVGGTVHNKFGKPDWQVVRRLCMGSLPASIATLAVLVDNDVGKVGADLVMKMLGVLLLLTAICTLARRAIHKQAKALRVETAQRFKAWQPALTVVAGVLLGVMVTLTSVGAGALGATFLLALYPLRMTAARLVGTDIIHAVPLTVVAGLGHLWIGNVDFGLLGSLLIGSIPGIIIGSLISTKISDKIVRIFLALALTATGVRLLV